MKYFKIYRVLKVAGEEEGTLPFFINSENVITQNVDTLEKPKFHININE